MVLFDKHDAKAFAIGFVLCYIISIGGYIYIHQFSQIGIWAFGSIIPSMFAGGMAMIARLVYAYGKWS